MHEGRIAICGYLRVGSRGSAMTNFESILTDIRLFRRTVSDDGFDNLLQELREAHYGRHALDARFRPSQPPVPSPGGQPLHPQSYSDESCEQWGQAALACSDQRNGSPERQTLCRITESFLASATRALPFPDRLAIARAQSFKLEALWIRARITTAASYNKVRASVSPHLDILPLRSTSPD